MKIAKDTIVTLSFRATDAQGKVLEDGKTPHAYLHGGYGNTLPGIEKALEGQEAGYTASLVLAPEDAFGERDESLGTRDDVVGNIFPGFRLPRLQGGNLRGPAWAGGSRSCTTGGPPTSRPGARSTRAALGAGRPSG